MSSDVDAKLANRILIGLVIGAVAGSVVLLIGGVAPPVLQAARWFEMRVTASRRNNAFQTEVVTSNDVRGVLIYRNFSCLSSS